MTSDNEDGIAVVVQPASALIYARLMHEKGDDLTFREAHALNAAMGKKLPKASLGKRLTAREAEAPLKKMG